MRVEDAAEARLFPDAVPEFRNPELDELVQCSRNGVLWLGLINESATEGFVGLDESFQRFVGVTVNKAFKAITAFGNRSGSNEDEGLMLAKEFLFDDDFRMRNFACRQFSQSFEVAALSQELAIKWAGNCFFAFLAATLRANIVSERGTIAFGSADIAERTLGWHQF